MVPNSLKKHMLGWFFGQLLSDYSMKSLDILANFQADKLVHMHRTSFLAEKGATKRPNVRFPSRLKCRMLTTPSSLKYAVDISPAGGLGW